MITIALFTSNHIISKLIAFVLGKRVSHSAIGFRKDGVDYFLHAAWGGVQIATREELLKQKILVAEFEVLADLDDEVVLAEQKVGQPYDTLGLFGYIPVLLARKFGWGIDNPLASKSAVVCSEFIIDLDVNGEIPEFYGLDPDTVTPRDLWDICLEGKSFRQIF